MAYSLWNVSYLCTYVHTPFGWCILEGKNGISLIFPLLHSLEEAFHRYSAKLALTKLILHTVTSKDADIISRGYKLPSLLNWLNLCFHRFNQEGFFHCIINKTTQTIDMVGTGLPSSVGSLGIIWSTLVAKEIFFLLSTESKCLTLKHSSKWSMNFFFPEVHL